MVATRQPATSIASQAENVLQGSKGKVAIVESTEVTGAGKTTLLLAAKDVLAGEGIIARDAYDCMNRPISSPLFFPSILLDC